MDIALELGFSERSAFHRAFRKWTGASPGEFRRNVAGLLSNEIEDNCAMDLSGKVLVVTGADGALGQAVAATLSAYGAKLALLSHAATTAGYAAGRRMALWRDRLDARDGGAFGDGTSRPRRRAHRRLDQCRRGISLGKTQRRHNRQLGRHVQAQFANRRGLLPGRAALPAARQSSGRIVNVGAMGAQKASAGMGPYAASKAGVARLTEALADELKDRGITVNAILPSTLDTPRNRVGYADRRISSVGSL